MFSPYLVKLEQARDAGGPPPQAISVLYAIPAASNSPPVRRRCSICPPHKLVWKRRHWAREPHSTQPRYSKRCSAKYGLPTPPSPYCKPRPCSRIWTAAYSFGTEASPSWVPSAAWLSHWRVLDSTRS
jgi:hypothetical protein